MAEHENGKSKGPDPLLNKIEEDLQQILTGIQALTPAAPTPPSGVPPSGRARPVPLSEADLPLPVIALPKCTTRAFGDITTTGAWEPIVAYTVSQGKTFRLAKIVASCNSAYEVQLYWKGKPITPIYKQPSAGVLTDWFPYGYADVTLAPIIGDGQSLLQLMGRYPSGGSADDLWGEIVGEED